MRNPYCRLTLLILCLHAFAAEGLLGQTNAEINAGFQFNFSTPGARSLGMGGTFIGLADDATAAYANPAGLTILSLPEVSLEVRHWSFSNVFTNGGQFNSTAKAPAADLHIGRDENDQNGLSFFSYAYPRSQWAVALYRHELAKLGADFTTEGARLGDQGSRLKPTNNALDLDIVNYGVAASFRISDSLSLGGGLSLYDFHITSKTDRISANSPTLDFRPENLVEKQTQNGSDQKLGFNAGFLWTLNSSWKLGGVYRHAPRLDFDARNLPGKKAPPSFKSEEFHAGFDVPDVFGLGVSFQPTEFKTVLLDVVHVSYSDLTHRFTKIVPESTDSCTTHHCRFIIHDATEIHVGFENNFPLSRSLISARIGAWYDPDHRIRYEGDEQAFQALFRSGRNEIHYAAGLGYISGSGRYQVDAAIDLSARVKTASISAVIRF